MTDPTGAGAVLALAALLLARVAPIVLLVPPLGARFAAGPARVAIALAVAALVLPASLPAAPAVAALPPAAYAAVLAKEAAVGVALGLCGSLVFWAAYAAGHLFEVARGTPASGAGAAGALADAYLLLAVAVFVAAGGPRLFLAAVGDSYLAVPLLGAPAFERAGSLAALALRLSADMVGLAVSLAAPVLIALLVADLVVGLIARMVPSMDALFVSLPARAWAGIALVLLGLGLGADTLARSLPDAARAVRKASDLLAP